MVQIMALKLIWDKLHGGPSHPSNELLEITATIINKTIIMKTNWHCLLWMNFTMRVYECACKLQ